MRSTCAAVAHDGQPDEIRGRNPKASTRSTILTANPPGPNTRQAAVVPGRAGRATTGPRLHAQRHKALGSVPDCHRFHQLVGRPRRQGPPVPGTRPRSRPKLSPRQAQRPNDRNRHGRRLEHGQRHCLPGSGTRSVMSPAVIGIRPTAAGGSGASSPPPRPTPPGRNSTPAYAPPTGKRAAMSAPGPRLGGSIKPGPAPEEGPDPTHLHPAAGSYAGHR
jgi:hypothetical protein